MGLRKQSEPFHSHGCLPVLRPYRLRKAPLPLLPGIPLFFFLRAVSPALKGSNCESFVAHNLCHTPGVAKLLSTARHMGLGLFHLLEHLQSEREGGEVCAEGEP